MEASVPKVPDRRPPNLDALRLAVRALLKTIDGKWGKGWHAKSRDVYADAQRACRDVLKALDGGPTEAELEEREKRRTKVVTAFVRALDGLREWTEGLPP